MQNFASEPSKERDRERVKETGEGVYMSVEDLLNHTSKQVYEPGLCLLL